jgi:alkanesulfonate monooxygenase SsuD/methylene tetrahydromethanopterin reductase-like flavin-dependent oxidoreductase (luciferase family)
LLAVSGRESERFRFVMNVFVHVATSQRQALIEADELLRRRHGGTPPYDPSVVVVGGPADQIADAIRELHNGGYHGINLVPVAMAIPQVEALVDVADLLEDLRH